MRVPWIACLIGLAGYSVGGIVMPTATAVAANKGAALLAPHEKANEPTEAVIELAFWNSVVANDSIPYYQAYLDQYPDGKFAPLARLKLSSLAAVTQPAPDSERAPTAEQTAAARVNAAVDQAIEAAHAAEQAAGLKASLAREAKDKVEEMASSTGALLNHSQRATVQNFAGLGRYQGETTDGLRNGYGLWVGADGERYEGEWRNGKRNGVGRSKSASGITYEGEWKDGSPCGVGILTWPNGDSYAGEYCQGDINGYGTYSFASESSPTLTLSGEWANGKLTGFGMRVSASGDRHEGAFKDGEPNGYGAETGADGSSERSRRGNYENGSLAVPVDENGLAYSALSQPRQPN